MVKLNLIGDLSLKNTKNNLYIFLFFVILFIIFMVLEFREILKDYLKNKDS